jgi:hypothetical protein
MIPRKSMTYFNKIKPVLIPILILLFAFGVAFTHHDQPVQASGLYNVTLDWVFMSDQWYPPAASWGNCGTIQCNGPADVGNTCTSHVKTGFTTCYNGDTSNCGNQADSVYSCKGPPACVPSNACAATTCNITTCGDGCGGQVLGTQVCGPVCSPSQGQGCPSAQNSCGMTNGTVACDGSCTPPADSTCVAPPACTPDSSCATNTCQGSPPCTDSCGTSYAGTKVCSGPAATANLIASSPTAPSMLTWSSTNATSCSGSGFTVPGGAASGSVVVSPVVSTNYSVTCSGAVSPTVTVGPAAAPSCTESGPGLTANPTRVESGQSVTLNWSGTTAAAGCTVTGPNGFNQPVSVDSSCNISAGSPTISNITAQSVYTLMCPGGQTSSVVVNIIPKFKEF